MKKLLGLLLAYCLITGCVGNNMKWKLYNANGNKIVEVVEVSNLGGMNNAKTDSFEITIETKSGFKTKLKLKGRDVKDSPESARALGDAGANIGSFGQVNWLRMLLIKS